MSERKTMLPDSDSSGTSALLPGATKRQRSITADWRSAATLIEGVGVKETRNVLKADGQLVEIFRRDWALGPGVVDHVFQLLLPPGAISAWHVHAVTTDRLFASQGTVTIALYDNRPGSATQGLVNEFRFGAARPAMVVVPPGVWHGVQNIGRDDAVVLNVTDQAYDYDDPDHWGLPADTDRIPYRFRIA